MSLFDYHLDLIEEWDYSKNTELNPASIHPGSHKEAWWICSKCGYSWHARIASRTGKYKTGCKRCAREKQTSFPEQALFFYIKQAFPDAVSQYPIDITNMEFDIYIPSISVAVEYDGPAHVSRKSSDQKKNDYCLTHGITLIRVLDISLTPWPDCICFKRTENKDMTFGVCIKEVLNFLNTRFLSIQTVDIDIKRDQALIMSGYQTSIKEHSILVLSPGVAKDWDYDANGSLTPDKVLNGSHAKVHWKCHLCGHTWAADVQSRTLAGNQCPNCHGGNKRKSSTRKKVLCVETGKTFNSISEAARACYPENWVSATTGISKCIRGKAEIFKGYHWIISS